MKAKMERAKIRNWKWPQPQPPNNQPTNKQSTKSKQRSKQTSKYAYKHNFMVSIISYPENSSLIQHQLLPVAPAIHKKQPKSQKYTSASKPRFAKTMAFYNHYLVVLLFFFLSFFLTDFSFCPFFSLSSSEVLTEGVFSDGDEYEDERHSPREGRVVREVVPRRGVVSNNKLKKKLKKRKRTIIKK